MYQDLHMSIDMCWRRISIITTRTCSIQAQESTHWRLHPLIQPEMQWVDAGFKAEPLKIAVPAGERKPLVVSCTAPQQPKAGSLAALGIQQTLTGVITGLLNGGSPAMQAAGTRVVLNVQCQLEPAARQ